MHHCSIQHFHLLDDMSSTALLLLLLLLLLLTHIHPSPLPFPCPAQRFGIWTAACIGIYLLYGMPSSALRDEKRNRLPGAMGPTPPSNAHLAKGAPMYKEPTAVRG